MEKESSTRAADGKDTAGSAKVQQQQHHCIVCGQVATSLHVSFVWLSGITFAKSFCVICIDYWNAPYSAAAYQIPTLAQAVHTEHHQIHSQPSLSPIHQRMPSLPLPNSFEHGSGQNVPGTPSYPIDGSNERIARLRSELQGVRTGIQRIVSGLQDLNETTHQQELAAEASLSSFAMSTTSAPRSPPRGSRSIFQGNLEASAWSNIPSPSRFHDPSTIRNLQPPDTARPRPGAQDPQLRVRQRAYLESDQQRQATVPSIMANEALTRNAHQRSGRENPFQALGTREDVERPDYQSPVANMYGNAWGEYRNAEVARQGQNLGALNVASRAETHQRTIPNPLTNPPAMPHYPPPYFANPALNGHQPYLSPTGLQGITPPDLNPQLHYPRRDAPDLAPQLRHPPRDASFGQPPRWSIHHLTAANSIRRQQNLSAPDRAGGHSETTSSIRRTSDAHRRAVHRGESDSAAFGRALEVAGGDRNPPRMGYPYVLPGGLSRDFLNGYHGQESGSETESEPALTFDTQDRPPPMDAESMMLDMSCSICKEHLVDTVVTPCGHAVMCNWCADLHVPACKQDKNTPKDRSVKCPVCRTRIKQKVSSRPRCLPMLTLGNQFRIFHA
jgi:Zinc finger, C3HC4 type (RING finger)